MVYALAVRGRFGLDMSDLGALANATGGRSIELKSSADISTAMQRIADELHAQYVLGFNPAKLDGKLHRLDISVKRSGATVRARRTYFAAKPDGK
jgi:VWFA-related protein